MKTILLTLAAIAILSGAGGSTGGAASDPANCGAVGFAVPAGDSCLYGVAVPGS